MRAHKYVDTKVSNVNDPTIDEEVENGPASIVEGTIVWDTRNNRFEPSRGGYVSFSAEYAGLLFDKKWSKWEGELRAYRQLVGDLVLRYRLVAGRILEVDSRPIPRSVKFFLGGPRNMRGYDLRKVGPQLEDPEDPGRFFALGGMSKLYTTLEFEYPLVREAGMKWAVFADAGNVYTDSFNREGGDFLRYDYGFGLRWFSPSAFCALSLAIPWIKKRTKMVANSFLM